MKLASLKQHSLLYPPDTLLSWQRLKRDCEKHSLLVLSPQSVGFGSGFWVLALTLTPWQSAARK
jgi:hypothetical protein